VVLEVHEGAPDMVGAEGAAHCQVRASAVTLPVEVRPETTQAAVERHSGHIRAAS
jgi:hypothetical protein